MSEFVAGSRRGGLEGERAALEAREALSARDGIFSLTHLINVRNLPLYDKAPRQWNLIADVETVDDFEPTTFQNFRADFSNLEFGKSTGGHQVSPKVVEGDTYQYAYGYTEEAVKAAIEKRGFKFGLTLEKLIGNFRRFIRTLPDDMLQVALETDEYLVFDKLVTAAAPSNRIAADTNPITGAATVANPTVSAEAIRVGLAQVSKRRDAHGNLIPLAPSYYVVVGLGRAEAVEDDIARAKSLVTLTTTPTGAQALSYNAPSIGRLGRVTGVIESAYVPDGAAWYLVPAAGTSARPGLVKLELAGRTAPEVLVNNFTGTPIRGGSGSSPFDLAHFDNDTVDVKLRQFTNSALITQDQLSWSNGSGQA